jgi:hypothetical protein
MIEAELRGILKVTIPSLIGLLEHENPIIMSATLSLFRKLAEHGE